MHPNGQIPAYEWAFGDVNPPVHAWAALRVFEIDGGRDYDFLDRVMHKLLLNFTWWVNRKDSDGNNVFEGGFLGLDNVGPFDRSAALPVAGVLEQSDGTAWMAMYALNLLDMALVLADPRPGLRGHRHQVLRALRLHRRGRVHAHGLWDEEDAFFYDVLRLHDGRIVPLKVRSVVGLLPLTATTGHRLGTLHRLPELGARLRWFLTNRPEYGDVIGARRLGPRRPAAAAAVHGRHRTSSSGILDRMLVRGRVPVRRTGCARCPGPTWTSRSRCAWRAGLQRRLRAGRVDQRAVRRQLQLARADLVPGELPAHRGAARLRRRSSATTSRCEYPTGSGQRCSPRRDRRRPLRPADRAVPRGRRGPATGLRRRRAVPDRPGLARPAAASTSTSTATPAPAWAPRTRPAGPRWSSDLIFGLRNPHRGPPQDPHPSM